MNSIVWFAVAACGFFVGCSEHEVCEFRNKHYSKAVSQKLEMDSVRHRVSAKGELCFTVNNLSEIRRTEREVDKYFAAVTGLFRNECEEKLIIDWAIRNNIALEVFDATDAKTGKPRRLFHIYSFSEEDVFKNRGKLLLEAPDESVCHPRAPGRGSNKRVERAP